MRAIKAYSVSFKHHPQSSLTWLFLLEMLALGVARTSDRVRGYLYLSFLSVFLDIFASFVNHTLDLAVSALEVVVGALEADVAVLVDLSESHYSTPPFSLHGQSGSWVTFTGV